MNITKRHEIRRSDDWLVYRAEDAESRRLYTIKEVAAGAPAGEHLLARLREEHDFLAGFNHPHLLRPLGLDPGRRRAVFEDSQCSLAQYLRAHGALAPPLVANVLSQLAGALGAMHASKKGHGAIDPHTVLVGPDGEVRFGDFLGYDFDGPAAVPMPDVELKYQAPEMIDASLGPRSPSSDLYGLGYLAVEALAGPSFPQQFDEGAADHWLAWHADLRKRLRDWRVAMHKVPRGLLVIIEALIEKDPAQRLYRSTGQLVDDLASSGHTSDQRLPPYRPADQAPRAAVPAPRRPAARAPSDRPALALVTRGTVPVQWFRPDRPVLVGRSLECDVCLPSASVSGRHALAVCDGRGRWHVHDLDSRSGTRVNGARLARALLREGDELLVGTIRCRVCLREPGAPRRRLVGGFELGEKIHEGANGALFRARWVARDGREAALRIYPAAFQFDEQSVRRFLRGIPRGGTIRHPNVVRLYRGGVLKGRAGHTWFLAMEYLPGGSLRDRLAAGGSLPVADVVRLGRDVARALGVAALRGFVHRNVTPSCVLFDDRGTAKLGDFSLLRDGVLTSQQAVTVADAPPGDHVYQAPEQLLGLSHLGPTCDIYCLAATMYEGLTGQPPFSRELPFLELVHAICGRPVRPPRELNPAVPPQLDALLVRALDKGPDARWQTLDEFRAALKSLPPT